jgi:transcriptional regulator of acetoin/glycerol metabolism
LQAALLRFLDDQTVRPVGGQAARKVDVQLLAASHACLDTAVRERQFREDLLYRLNTVRVTLPPLRERSDLAAAARWVLRGIDASAQLLDDALPVLQQRAWPGNFRELRSALTRALLARPAGPHGACLGAADLRAVLPGPAPVPDAAPRSALQRTAAELVRAEFQRNGGSVSETSRVLGISRTTVYRHLRTQG